MSLHIDLPLERAHSFQRGATPGILHLRDSAARWGDEPVITFSGRPAVIDDLIESLSQVDEAAWAEAQTHLTALADFVDGQADLSPGERAEARALVGALVRTLRTVRQSITVPPSPIYDSADFSVVRVRHGVFALRCRHCKFTTPEGSDHEALRACGLNHRDAVHGARRLVRS